MPSYMTYCLLNNTLDFQILAVKTNPPAQAKAKRISITKAVPRKAMTSKSHTTTSSPTATTQLLITVALSK
jgi:hypothetical protein